MPRSNPTRSRERKIEPLPATARATAARRAVWRDGERERILPRLVPVTPADLADASLAGRSRVIDLLARALGSERRRGRMGHWSYSLARHLGLIEAMAAETDLWRREWGALPCPRPLAVVLPVSLPGAAARDPATRRAETTKRRGS